MRDILFCHDNNKYPADEVYNKLYKKVFSIFKKYCEKIPSMIKL